MTENAVLLVTRPKLLLERTGGLTVLERHAITAQRAGIKHLWVGAAKPDDDVLARLRLPPGFVSWSMRDAAGQCPTPYLLLSGDHFLRAATLRYLVRSDYGCHATLEDAAGAAVVQVVPWKNVDDKLPDPKRQRLPTGATVFIESPASGGPVLTWLLSAGTKAQDGFMARYFDRYISLAVSRRLLDTAVTPNMMTVISALIGLAGSAFFLVPAHAARLAGAALVWLHSVLDGCDGELARLRFQESASGALMDFWSDNLVHLALFACMAWGFYVADHDVWPILAGLLCAVGTVGSAVMVHRERQTSEVARPDGVPSALGKLENILAARDFIYVLVILAYFDKLYEFMWMTAVGSILFFTMTLYLGRTENEQASQPHPPREGQARGPSAGHGGSQQHLYSGR